MAIHFSFEWILFPCGISIYLSIHTHRETHTETHTHRHAHTHTHTHTHIYIYIYTLTHTHTHTYIYLCVSVCRDRSKDRSRLISSERPNFHIIEYQHPTKQRLDGYLPPIVHNIQVRWLSHAWQCWESNDLYKRRSLVNSYILDIQMLSDLKIITSDQFGHKMLNRNRPVVLDDGKTDRQTYKES